MAFKLKDIIFSKYPRKMQVEDSYKDYSNRGLLQRYNEMVAEDGDENEIGSIVDFIENVIDPDTLYERLLFYKEMDCGVTTNFLSSVEFRRKFIHYVEYILKIKGTIPSYEMCYRLMGFDVRVDLGIGWHLSDGEPYYVGGQAGNIVTVSGELTLGGTGTTVYNAGDKFVFDGSLYLDGADITAVTGSGRLSRSTIVETWDNLYGFDKEIGFDAEDRRFDGKCATCSPYSIYLYGTLTLTIELLHDVFKVIKFVEPINADLVNVYYNLMPILTGLTSIWIDENGDLNYTTTDPDLVITLAANGDLFFNGTNAGRYHLDENGDIIFDL